MAEETGSEENDRQVSFAEALAREGDSAVPDADLDDEAGDEGGSVLGDDETKPDDSETDSEKPADKDKDGKSKSKWDDGRQKRDQERAKRMAALETSQAAVVARVEEMSETNRQLLAQLVERAGKKDDADKSPSPEPDDLAAAIEALDPETAEFADVLKVVTAFSKDVKGSKALTAELKQALAEQAKHLKEALAEQAKRHDDRDRRDANRAAQDEVVGHLDALMIERFKGKQAMRKEVEKRSQEILVEAGYKPDEPIQVKTAKMALTTAANEVAAKLEAERKGRENPPTQDILAGGGFAEALQRGSQTTKEAMDTMGKRAR